MSAMDCQLQNMHKCGKCFRLMDKGDKYWKLLTYLRKKLQVSGAVLGVQFKQVIYVLRGFNVHKELEVTQCQLCCHF